MAHLVLFSEGGRSQRIPLHGHSLVMGRQPGVGLHIPQPSVSRAHACITCERDFFFLEDMGSSNGTYLNGMQIQGKVGLQHQDRIRLGQCELMFEQEEAPEPSLVIRAEVVAQTTNPALLQDAANKLRAVLDISHHLAQARTLDELLPRLLDHLFMLFPKADRGLVVLREGDRLVVRASRSQPRARQVGDLYSRSVVRRVLAEGVGVVVADQGDSTATLVSAGIHTFMCVPLKSRTGQALGALQLDGSRGDAQFHLDDLHLLTAVSLQVSSVLENTVLHAELLEHERVKRDLALARLAQLAAGVAHEVNNPLSIVLNNTTVCQRDLAALAKLLEMYQRSEPAWAEQQPDMLREIHDYATDIDLPYTLKNFDDILIRSRDGLKRIQQIVADLRSFARLNDTETDSVNLTTCLEAAAGIAAGLASKRQVQLTLALQPLPPLPCQPARLNQAVFNLLANAIDACGPGGTVVLRSAQAGDFLEIHVEDTGCGIEAANLEKIFDPFFTTKPLGKGVGLGLSIAHGIVTDHGGAITVASQPGKGAQFVIRLPKEGKKA